MAKQNSVDEILQRIETVLGQMEAENLTLEEAFRYYEQGMKLIQACEKQIGTIEKKVKMITESGEIDAFEA